MDYMNLSKDGINMILLGVLVTIVVYKLLKWEIK